jgi:CheY-like chemotaxis protein
MNHHPVDSGSGLQADSLPSGSRILLASDSIVEQKLAIGLLARYGCQVDVARSASEAVQRSVSEEWDAVLVDGWVTELSAADVVRAIRQRQGSTTLVTVILAMVDESDSCCTFSAPGIDGVVRKPLRIEELHEWLWRARRGAAAPANSLAAGSPNTVNSASDPPDTVAWDELLAAVGGEREMIGELIEIFFEEYPPTLAAIRTAIEQQDAKGLQLFAHKLKGCLRYFGNTTAAGRARALEEMGRNGQLTHAPRECDRLDADLDRLLPILRAGPG